MIFVAEIGSSHRGQSGLAYELIRQASLAGADIVMKDRASYKQ
jgi:sialic acid synthase SpsE